MRPDISIVRANDTIQSMRSMRDQAGLRRRMRRAATQIREQHRQIAPLFDDLNAMLAEGHLRDAQTTAFRVQGALQAHFLLEEQIVFPVIHALCPERSNELVVMVENHASLESSFSALIDHILAAALGTAEAKEALGAFAATLSDHETREEILLQAAIGAQS